jgi:hypothetical protein
MYSTEKELDELLHDWLHTFPIQEIHPPVNTIVKRFRKNKMDINSAKIALLDHFAYLNGCKKNNHFIAMAMDEIPDS